MISRFLLSTYPDAFTTGAALNYLAQLYRRLHSVKGDEVSMKTFLLGPAGLNRRVLFSSFALLPSLIGALRSTPAFSQTQS